MPTPDEIRQEQIRREQARRLGQHQPGRDYTGSPVGGPPQPTTMENIGGAVRNFFQPPLDATRVLADTVSRGYLDSLSPDAAVQTQKTQEARDRLGWRALPLEIGEGIVEPTPGAKLKVVEKAGPLAKAAISSGTGGLDAAISAYGHGAPLTELPGEFAKGAGITAAVRKLVNTPLKWLERRKLKEGQTYKNADELRRGRQAEYAKVDADTGVYRARDLRALHAQLAQMDLVPGVDDPAINVLKKLNKDWRGKNMTAAELDKAMQFIRQKVKGTGDQAAGLQNVSGDMVDAMRQFEKNTPLVERVVDPNTGRVSYKQASQDVKKNLETGRDLAARENKLRAVERTTRVARLKHKSGRFDPFGQSLESARAKQFTQLREKITEGKTKTAPFTKNEAAGVESLSEGTRRRNIGGGAEHLSFSGKLLPAATALSAFVPGIGPPLTLAGGAVATGAEILHRFGQKATNKEIEDLGALIRDPAGRGLKSDPAKIAAAKDQLAKITRAGVRANIARRNRGEQ